METLPMLPAGNAEISADMVVAFENRIAAIVSSFDDKEVLLDWREKAAAMERYLKSKELQTPMLGAQRRVEARLGQLMPAQQGSKLVGHDQQVEKGTRYDFRVLALALSGEVSINAEEWRKSRRSLVGLIRRRGGLIPPTPDLPEGKYSCIVADPPWQLETGPEFGTQSASVGGNMGHESLEYDTMPLDEIKKINVGEHAADDAHLYLWTTNKYIEAAYEVGRAWGFKPSVLLVWAKTPRGIGLGDAYRLTTEFILYCRRGSLKERDICKTTWFNWNRGKHSEKPEEFFELVERMSPSKKGQRLEMFSRKKREGWTTWGHEV